MRFDSFADAYNTILIHLKTWGAQSAPRGLQTTELLGMKFALTDPRSRLALSPGRRFSLPFALAEFLWIVNRRNDLGFIKAYNKRYAQFSDDGEKLYGAYGPRVDLDGIVEKFETDPDSRQAVATIHNAYDLVVWSKDVPCTISWQFLVRDRKLHMICTMRSNDVYWGLPYDVFTNTMIQEWMALRLGVGLGAYHHQVGSMHAYDGKLGDIMGRKFEAVEMPPMGDSSFVSKLTRIEEKVRHHEEWNTPLVTGLLADCQEVFRAYWRKQRGSRFADAFMSGWAQAMMQDWLKEEKSVGQQEAQEEKQVRETSSGPQ